MSMKRNDVVVPLDVIPEHRDDYIDNYLEITRKTGRLMLFAGDQKVEHLNDDFFGPKAGKDDSEPEHLFRVADAADIGVFATQLGLIARYGMDYGDVPYLVKLNSKTNLVKTAQSDPFSNQWLDVEHVVEMKETSGLKILGVGYTVYVGSEYEAEMLQQAARLVNDAHRYGLVTVLWMYPRGNAVKDERDPHLIAGATGVAACLGTDFAKVNYPKQEGAESREIFKEAIMAAGRTKVVCAGGSSRDIPGFLQDLYDQIHISGAFGNATGRNIHQRNFDEAVKITNAISNVTLHDMDVRAAMDSAGLS